MSFTPEQSVRSSSSSIKQLDPIWYRPISVTISQDSNFRHARFGQEFAIVEMAASVTKRQQVKSSVVKLQQPTTCIIPMLVTPIHLLKPSSTKDLQLEPMIWRIKSETRTPSILITLKCFKFFKPLVRGAESSFRKCPRNSISLYHTYNSKIRCGIKYIHQNFR